MSTYTDPHGKLKKANVALTVCTGFVIAAVGAAISMQYWGIAIPSILSPLAVFAATPLGIGVLIGFGLFLACSMIYGISKNNKISEMKGPKIVIGNGSTIGLQVTEEDLKFITEECKNPDAESTECLIHFTNSKDEACYITGKYSEAMQLGNSVFLEINSVAVKDKDGNYNLIKENDKKLSALGLGAETEDKKECPIDRLILPSSKVEKPKAEEQGKEKGPKKK